MIEPVSEDLTAEQDLFEHFRFIVDPGQSLLRIDRYLGARIESASRTRIQSAAEAGNILVNSRVVKSNYKVKPGDLIQILLPYPSRTIKLIPENIPINIEYEDDQVIVINKKPGMVVHPAYGNYSGTLINALMWHLRDNPLFTSGEMRPGLVHRLDKNTSGLIVIAKTELALNHLGRQFFERTTERRYLALVWGVPSPAEGTIIGNIGRNPKDRKLMYVYQDGSEGRHAVTHYTVLDNLGYISLVACRLETGRTHQIRVHMSHIGHPVFNDEDYGGNRILRGTTFSKYQQFVKNCFSLLPRQALHAARLGFTHPVSGQRLTFDTPLPDDMQQVIDKWKAYITSRE